MNKRPKLYFHILSFVIILIMSNCKESDTRTSGTNISLFLKRDSVQVNEIKSDSADLFQKVGHHGPAIENEFFALRMYFNNSGAIDVYSKSKKQLELKETLWYPDSLMQQKGYGSDQYKAGNTVGLGGIKLWDGDTIVDLVATRGRTARVYKNDHVAQMEMVARGVPLKQDSVDILIRVQVRSGSRFAEVTAFSDRGGPVQFVTGVNYHPGSEIFTGKNYAGTWGIHPEDVAIDPAGLGAAVICDPGDFPRYIKTKNQLLFISRPLEKINTLITTASSNEKKINNYQSFKSLVKSELQKN